MLELLAQAHTIYHSTLDSSKLILRVLMVLDSDFLSLFTQNWDETTFTGTFFGKAHLMMNGFFESFFFEENMAGMYDCWMAHDLFKTDRRLGISQMFLDPTIGGKLDGTYNYMWATMVDAPDTWAKCMQAPMID